MKKYANISVQTAWDISVVESVKKLAGNSKCDFCVGCFTEKYPIEVPKDMPKDKFESKISEKK